MRRPFVAGNWKMNTTRESARGLASAIAQWSQGRDSAADVALCPPFPYLLEVGAVLAGTAVELGGQDAYFEEPGAFTGEVAFDMLLDVGCRWVILGHSERRHVLGESDEVVGKKVTVGLSKGIGVILCVGELLSEREAGQTEAVLDRQMETALDNIKAEQLGDVVIAYEPVWAIGTGVTASPEQAELAHVHLRNWLADHYNSETGDSIRILYGGSVKADNALALISQPNIDGALVGGASLKADTFLPIVEAAEETATV